MAKLKLLSLVCNVTEDWTGPDEAYLLVHGTRVWGPESMNDNDVENLGQVEPIPFTSNARIDLYDQDVGGWFDDDDHLGRTYARSSKAGQGEIEYNFTSDQANYVLTYEVLR